MSPRPSKYAGTEQRMEAIIQAALTCFSKKGLEHTTMAEVKRLSGASHGSIYHHFRSKGQLAAAVYLKGIASYQAGILRALSGIDGAKEGIHAMVDYHLRWVEQNPDWARYLLQLRYAEFMKESEAALRKQNRVWMKQLSPWFIRHIQAGNIRQLPRELYPALIFGPCQTVTWLLLSGEVSTDIGALSDELGEAAWKALRQTKHKEV